MAKLSVKQQQFVDEYLIDLNATQAAIRAGYSPVSAEVQGCRLISNAKVSAAISILMAERSRRTGINQDRVMNELAKIAFVNATDVINMDEASVLDASAREDTAAIQSVKVKRIPTEDGDIVEREVKLNDKIRALELLGKHLGLFSDKLKIDGMIPVVIQNDLEPD